MNNLVVRPARSQSVGARQQHLLTAQQRLMIMMLLFIAAFVLIGGRLLYYGLFDAGPARSNYSGAFTPARADIVDRNGVPLARTINGSALIPIRY
jgi:cell division protein FtsI (penicillin-binding protein 3)